MNELEQFCILARTQKSRACAALIQQVLNHRKIYVFGELLAQPSVQSLQDTEFSKSYKSLELFAYGTYTDYLGNPEAYLELTDLQINKLRHLTLISLAAKEKAIPYSLMQKELGVDSIRALEDLIIEAMYAGLLHGKLDPMNGVFRVKSAVARDVKQEDIAVMIEMLNDWKQMIGSLTEAVKSSSSHMAERRGVEAEEQKSTQAAYDARKKEIKDLVEAGESVEDIMHSLGETGGAGGAGIEHGGQLSGKTRTHSGTRPSSSSTSAGAGKHPRRQQPQMNVMGLFGRR